MSLPAALRVAPRRHGVFRRSVFSCAERLLVSLGGRRFYRHCFLASGRLVLRDEIVRVPGLPPALEGFTLAHLSDLHAGPFLGSGDLSDAVAAVNARGVDLVCLTGDFVAHSGDDVAHVIDDLAGLESRHGAFAVFGNHDYRGRCEARIEAGFQARGMRFLRNAGARIQVGDAHLALTGLEDLEEAWRVDLPAARAGHATGDVEVVLCHNPGGAPAIARPGCAVILSGHTHGTQLDLPFLRRLGPAHPGLRVELGTTTLIVSRGLGVVGAPLRIGAPAEVVFVTLVAAGGAR